MLLHKIPMGTFSVSVLLACSAATQPLPTLHELTGTWGSTAFSVSQSTAPGTIQRGNMSLIVNNSGGVSAPRTMANGGTVVLQGTADEATNTLTLNGFNADGSAATFAYLVNPVTPTEMTLSAMAVVWDFGSGPVPADAVGSFVRAP